MWSCDSRVLLRGPGFVSGDGEGSGCVRAAGGCSEVSGDPVLRVVGRFDGSGWCLSAAEVSSSPSPASGAAAFRRSCETVDRPVDRCRLVIFPFPARFCLLWVVWVLG